MKPTTNTTLAVSLLAGVFLFGIEAVAQTNSPPAATATRPAEQPQEQSVPKPDHRRNLSRSDGQADERERKGQGRARGEIAGNNQPSVDVVDRRVHSARHQTKPTLQPQHSPAGLFFMGWPEFSASSPFL